MDSEIGKLVDTEHLNGGFALNEMYGFYGETLPKTSFLMEMVKEAQKQGKAIIYMDTEMSFDSFSNRLKKLTSVDSVCSKIPTPKEVEKSILAACEHTTKLIDETQAEIKRVDEINARVEVEAKATGGLGDSEC